MTEIVEIESRNNYIQNYINIIKFKRNDNYFNSTYY